jgi:site-specific DNA recombinase
MFAVVYYRYSSDNQREESIFAQRRVVEEYTQKEGITVIREYIDEAESAKNDDRPNFLQMVDDITSGAITPDYILVHKLNRFARNRYDAAMYRRKFKNHGAKLISVTQPIDDSPEGIILEAMLDAMAEYQSLDLGREAFKGLKENALQGIHTGGVPPLGYNVDKQTKKYLLNEQEATIVKLIFGMARTGSSYSVIMEECNRRGYKTKRGKPFGKNSIHDILRNEKYYGTLVFHKRNNDKNSHQFRPKEDWIIIEDALPVIIPKNEWDEVQKIMDGRKQNRTGPKNRGDRPYILTGKIECGECNGAYVGSRSKGRNGEYYYFYTCSGKKRLKNCSNKDIRKELLENFVLDRLEEVFAQQSIEKWVDKIETEYKNMMKDEDKELEYVAREIERLTKQINRFLDAFADGKMPADIAGPKLETLGREKKNLETRLAELGHEVKLLTHQDILLYVKKLKVILSDRNDFAECKNIIDSYIHKIIIYPNDEIEVVYKFSFGYSGSPKGNILISETYSRKDVYVKK